MQQRNFPGHNPVDDMLTGLRPAAQAIVEGSRDYPDLTGVVTFYQTGAGTMVSAAFQGLPSAAGGVPEKANAFSEKANAFSEKANAFSEKANAFSGKANAYPGNASACSGKVLGFHIHEGNVCAEGTPEPFSSAGGHYNPGGCAHPYHAGDMPPLFENNGFAWQAFFTQRFTAEEVIGKTVVVHSDRDDFTSQPAGNAGKRIACGVIRRA